MGDATGQYAETNRLLAQLKEAGKRRCIGRRRKPDRDLEQGGLEREECLR